MAPDPVTFQPHDLDLLGEAHTRLGDEVRSACQPDPGVLAASGAYGAAGASFTIALNGYLTRLKASGEQLGQRYSGQGAAIRETSKLLVGIDAHNASQIPPTR